MTDIIDIRPLFLIGPGNNGGDGLVAARHLKVFGAQPTLWYPKRPSNSSNSGLYNSLLSQCELLDIPVLPNDSDCVLSFLKGSGDSHSEYTVIVDAIFGFGYKRRTGDSANPFDEILDALCNNQRRIPVIAVDVPSGWLVDGSPNEECDATNGYMPSALISLTAPKECSKYYTSPHHYLGGRSFLSQRLADRFKLDFPMSAFRGTDQTTLLDNQIKSL